MEKQLQVGLRYITRSGIVVRITEMVSDPSDPWPFKGTYFSGRRIIEDSWAPDGAHFNHNESDLDLVLVREEEELEIKVVPDEEESPNVVPVEEKAAAPDMINHPPHYTFSAIEPIEAMEAWELELHEGTAVAYIARAKHKGERLQDLKKARWWLDRKITLLMAD